MLRLLVSAQSLVVFVLAPLHLIDLMAILPFWVEQIDHLLGIEMQAVHCGLNP